MQQLFFTYLELGFKHILDLNGYDHILFLIALCAVYTIGEWKKVALLATAFTLGHSLTLALAALEIVAFPSDVIEFLIPVTIFLTAVHNVSKWGSTGNSDFRSGRINYFLAAFFGLIHGMGFSNFFRSAAMPGEEHQIVSQLLAFNLGVELGQLVVVLMSLALSSIFIGMFKTLKRDWTTFVSGAAAGVALMLMIETKFW